MNKRMKEKVKFLIAVLVVNTVVVLGMELVNDVYVKELAMQRVNTEKHLEYVKSMERE